MHVPAVKVAGSDVIAEISLHENLFTDSRCNFSQENPKITDI